MPEYAPGTPSWVDLSSSDADASASFYGEVLGWNATEPGPVPPRGVCFASAPEPAAMFRFTVRAATVAAAQAAAEGACRAALTDTLAELSAPRAPSEFDWRVDAEAYPLGSRAAFNAAISEG